MGTRLAAGILAAARQGGVTPTGLLLSIDTTPEPLGTSLPAPPAYRSGLRSAANASSLTAPPRRRSVKPAPFAYHRPTTLDETLRLLAELASQEGRVLAGGQSLAPMMAFRLARPAYLIDINAVAGLDRLAVRDGALRVGACVRHSEFHRPVIEGPL